MDNSTKSTDSRYLLAALIEIYRGNSVPLPEFDPDMERNLLLDVFSTAISFARLDESRRALSEEIHKCSREGATVREQADLAITQITDMLNSKMLAAAHLMKIMDGGKFKLS